MNNLATVRQRLQDDLQERIVQAEKIDARLSEPGDQDWEERAIERENNEVLDKMGTSLLQEIRQIKEAIARIDSGTYGKCSGCGKQIHQERLSLMPFATTCTACSV